MVVIGPDTSDFTIGTAESEAKWGRDNDEKPLGRLSSPGLTPSGDSRSRAVDLLRAGIKPEPCYFWTGKELAARSAERSLAGSGFRTGRQPSRRLCELERCPRLSQVAQWAGGADLRKTLITYKRSRVGIRKPRGSALAMTLHLGSRTPRSAFHAIHPFASLFQLGIVAENVLLVEASRRGEDRYAAIRGRAMTRSCKVTILGCCGSANIVITMLKA